MTEQEAKTKWCPMIRSSAGIESNCATNTYDESYTHPSCIASDCMMWRYKTNGQMGYDRNPDDICLASGYCGLGGF